MGTRTLVTRAHRYARIQTQWIQHSGQAFIHQGARLWRCHQALWPVAPLVAYQPRDGAERLSWKETAVEGLNGKGKLTTKKAFGLKKYASLRMDRSKRRQIGLVACYIDFGPGRMGPATGPAGLFWGTVGSDRLALDAGAERRNVATETPSLDPPSLTSASVDSAPRLFSHSTKRVSCCFVGW